MTFSKAFSRSELWDYLSDFDKRIFFELVKFWKETKKPDNSCVFSGEKLAKTLNLPWRIETREAINDALTRLRLSDIRRTNREIISILIDLRIQTIRSANSSKVEELVEFQFSRQVIEKLTNLKEGTEDFLRERKTAAQSS